MSGYPIDVDDHVTPSPRYKALGAFRLVLALIVIANHGAWAAKGTPIGDLLIGSKFGTAAVLMFFVLSGYVITEAATTFYARRPFAYATNRALKIVPAFVAALILSLMVHLVLKSQDRLLEGIAFEGYTAVPSGMFGSVNLTFNVLSVLPLPTDFVRWLFATDLYLFVRYIWAVQVEVAFYAVVFVIMVSWPRIRRYPLVLLGTFVVASLIAERATYELQFAPYFAIGALVFLGRARVPYFSWFVGAAVALIAVHLWRFLPNIQAVTMLAALVAAFFLLLRLNPAPSMARIDRRLGDLSYALYLNQYAVLVVFSSLSMATGAPVFVALIVCGLAVSLAMYVLIEAPLVQIRSRIRLAAQRRQAPRRQSASFEGRRLGHDNP